MVELTYPDGVDDKFGERYLRGLDDTCGIADEVDRKRALACLLYPDTPADIALIRMEYRLNAGKEIDLTAPHDIAAKLHWLKLNDRRPLNGMLVDKFAVREYVADRVSPDILNHCYGVYRDPADIDFSRLPGSFMIKATHGWNMNLACLDKNHLDTDAVVRQARTWLATRHERRHGEWAYSLVEPRLVIEELIGDDSLCDYKFFCFNGEPRFVKLDLDRGTVHAQSYLSLDWVPLPFANPRRPPIAHLPAQPEGFDRMVEIARSLAADLPFVRVDLYNLSGHIRFGEMTLYPCGGNLHVTPPEWGDTLGDLLTLPVSAVRGQL